MGKIWTEETAPPQTGRTAIVTGATSGLGFEVSMVLASLGARVIMAARSKERAEEAISRIRELHPGAIVTFVPLNLASLTSVNQFTSKLPADVKHLDLLINNAGIMIPPYRLTEDGFESQLASNYLGHFLLTGRLLPLLENSPGARVVTVSSIAHKAGKIRFHDLNFKKGYNRFKAYSQSKLACLIFAYELQRRLEYNGSHILSVAAHPGVSSTRLGRHLPGFMESVFSGFGQSAKAGAKPILRAAFDQQITGGEYFGPDGWMEMRGNPAIVGSSHLSRNHEVARKLWDISEQLTGFEYLH